MSETEQRVLSVTQINVYIKHVVESAPFLRSVYIKGEISNFVNHKTGHLYFTLKDEGGLIKSVMFKSSTSKLQFMPENGMKVIAHGRVSVFVRDGQYIFYVDRLEPDGIGALYLAYEQLKKKLEAEGLFRSDLKKPIPKIPTKIGIITSPTGAAIRDMINILGRRFPLAKITLYPSQVQGEIASKQLTEGIKFFNKNKSVDVIIIGRGGGSIEDLWAFNNEELARIIFASDIPVISAVGHETDFTICDFVADLRAPTPSAAAELAVPETTELKRKITNIIGRMELLVNQNIELKRRRVKQFSERRVLNSPSYIIDDKRMALLSVTQRLESGIKLIISEKHRKFIENTAKLEALNPMSIISRGYSAVFDENGILIKSIEQINVGEKFNFKTIDGTVYGEVTGKRGSNE